MKTATELTTIYLADKTRTAAAREGGSQSSLNQTNLCHKKQSFEQMSQRLKMDLNFTGGDIDKGVVYRRSVIIKDAIKHVLDHQDAYDRADPKFRKNLLNDLVQYLKGRYIEPSFVVKEQAQENAIRDALMAWRYLAEETRTPIHLPRKLVEIEGIKKTIMPDVAFKSGLGDGIELVWYKIGKPTMTNTGRNNAFNRDMQLYLGVLYGRSLGYRNITSSYYFLKFTDDRASWDACPQSFFGHSSNIISMTDEWIEEEAENNALDSQMQLMKAMLRVGTDAENMSEKDCAYCDFKDMCQFKRPSKPIVEEGAKVV